MGLGTVEAFNNEGWGRLQWGINDWGDAGSSVQAAVTGIAMTAALGSPTEVTGDATIVANTLNVAQLTLGVVDPAPDAACNWKLYDRCFRYFRIARRCFYLFQQVFH